MAFCTDPDQLTATEVSINVNTRKWGLSAAGNLTGGGTTAGDDGATGQCLYSYFKEEWRYCTEYDGGSSFDYLIKHPFPMLPLTREQYEFGNNGSQFNGWGPLNDTTRQFLRTCGWGEFDAATTLLREYAGIITLGGPEVDDQVYYDNQDGQTPTNFVYPGPVNEAVQIYGDSNNGDFTRKSKFDIYIREPSQAFNASSIGDIGVTTMENLVNRFPLATDADANYDVNTDFGIGSAPWNAMTITYYDSAQPHTIDSVSYDFHVEIDGNGADIYDIYTFVQYQLQQGSDIDDGATFSVIGKTADALVYFDGTTLVTNYVDETDQGQTDVVGGTIVLNFDNNDKNSIKFTDDLEALIAYNYVAAGLFDFNINLESDASGKYWAYWAYTYSEVSAANTAITSSAGNNCTIVNTTDMDFSNLIAGDQVKFTGFATTDNDGIYEVVTATDADNIDVTKIRDIDGVTLTAPADEASQSATIFYNPHGTESALLVEDSTGTAIKGDISASDTVSWDFAYDGNIQGGRVAGVNANCIAVAIGLETAQYIEQPFTISASTGINVALNANRERVYSNAA